VSTKTFDLDGAWELHPSVAVRAERFGALLYHFGTRRLSFLKTPALRDAVTGLAAAPTARAALESAGVAAEQARCYRNALAGLAASDMIRERSSS
jgi:putative mycofactocin binding protein MftB